MRFNGFQLYRRAYSGLSANVWYLSAVMLINRSGTMVVPFLTIYCTQALHFSISQAGIIMAVYGAGAILGAYVGGIITDKFGFYKQQLLALFSGGTLFIITGYLDTFYTLCTGAFFLSIFNESFRPANAAAIAAYSHPQNVTRAFSLNRLAINLGWAFGGGLGGYIASINYNLLFWVDGCTNIGAALLLLKLLPYKKEHTIKSQTNDAIPMVSPYGDKPYLLFAILTILFGFCFFNFFTIVPVFLKTNWQFNEQLIGLLMALNGLIIVIFEMIVVYNCEGKRPLTFFIKIGVFLIGISFLTLNFPEPSEWIAFLFIIIISIGEIFSMPFMNTFWISRTNAANRGQYAALYTMAWSIAQIAAPALGGLVAEHLGYSVQWYFLFLISVVAALGFAYLKENSSNT